MASSEVYFFIFVKVGKSPKYDLSITPVRPNLMVKCIVATAA
jgi:hypothetical protein